MSAPGLHPAEVLETRCCIAGGGPAGMMLGLLLARAGVDVVVLEKHTDFLRDFRGDTIHPSTLEVIGELGLLDDFLALPHQEVEELRGVVGPFEVTLADFRGLPTRCRFIALIPQWDFLDFLADEARRYPTFRLRMGTRATGLLEEDGAVTGVRAEGPGGAIEVRAALTVGADGRESTVREASGLPIRDLGAPMDVFWMRISRRESDPAVPFGKIDRGRVFVLVYRGDYWQCGYVIPKDTGAEIRARGIDAFRKEVTSMAPFLGDRVEELRDWDDVKLLTVRVDRLERWHRPGLICIGDAAHAMSPVGGVGINLAIQDAVALANVAAGPLRNGRIDGSDLARVERRRMLPTRITQRVQVLVQNYVIRPSLEARTWTRPPLVVRLFRRWPALRLIPARLVGIGFRPEHVLSEAVSARAPATGPPGSGPR